MNLSFIPRLALVSAVASVLAACASTTVPQETPDWDVQTRLHVEDKLADSARKAALAQEELARIQQTRTPAAPSGINEEFLPSELRRLTTIDWSGPGSDLVAKIAENIGYEFSESGNKPAIPPIVHLSRTDTSVAKVLEDIGLQIQPVAQVVADPSKARLEYRYLNSDGSKMPSSPSLRPKMTK